MRKLSLVILLLAPACFVDVPDVDEAEFACATSDDCANGYECIDNRCRGDGSSPDACAGNNCAARICVPDTSLPVGYRCETCDVAKRCEQSGEVCVATAPAEPDPFICLPGNADARLLYLPQPHEITHEIQQ